MRVCVREQNSKTMKENVKPQSTVLSNERVLKALNNLIDARNNLNKAKLSAEEKECTLPQVNAVICNLETVFVERLKHDFPSRGHEGVTLPDVFAPDEVIAEMHFDYDV